MEIHYTPKGVCSRQVDKSEMIALEVEETFLGIHCYAAIVAYMLMCA